MLVSLTPDGNICTERTYYAMICEIDATACKVTFHVTDDVALPSIKSWFTIEPYGPQSACGLILFKTRYEIAALKRIVRRIEYEEAREQ